MTPFCSLLISARLSVDFILSLSRGMATVEQRGNVLCVMWVLVLGHGNVCLRFELHLHRGHFNLPGAGLAVSLSFSFSQDSFK